MAKWNAEKQEWEWTEAELEAEIEAGKQRTAELRKGRPLLAVTAARYLENERRVLVDLDNGTSFIFPVDHVQELAGKTNEELRDVQVLSDDAIAWDGIDVMVPVSDLMAGTFGSQAWMKHLSAMGKKGGAARSAAKTAASRANGAKGGRPKKARA